MLEPLSTSKKNRSQPRRFRLYLMLQPLASSNKDFVSTCYALSHTNTCRRIQQMPNRFFSEHCAYVGITSGSQESRNNQLSAIHQLTIDNIYVGVWPPTVNEVWKMKKRLFFFELFYSFRR